MYFTRLKRNTYELCHDDGRGFVDKEEMIKKQNEKEAKAKAQRKGSVMFK